MDIAARVEGRREFLGACMKKMVGPEFLSDAKRRWELGWFTSVTSRFLVLGDIVVNRRGDCLLETKESDVNIPPFSEKGRKDLTYGVWKEIITKPIEGMRPKINGDRFIYDRENKCLQGFITVPIRFSESFDLQGMVIEYYANEWTCVWPLVSSSFFVEMQIQGRWEKVEIRAHPFKPASSFLPDWERYCQHKYDGMMVWYNGTEYRTKWVPTVEVDINGDVWEVYLTDKLVPMRPRPGKTPVHMSNAVSKIVSCLRTNALRSFLHLGLSVPPEIVPVAKTAPKSQMIGSKVVFLAPGRKVVMIREPGKRLDFIGGRVEFGESPEDAATREIKEEVSVVMDRSDLIYLGVTKEESDTGTWVSHVFLAWAPRTILSHENVEQYAMGSFSVWKNSDLGRPRQVWVARHLDFLSANYANTDMLMAVLYMTGKVAPTAPWTPHSAGLGLFYKYRSDYIVRLTQVLREYSRGIKEGMKMDRFLIRSILEHRHYYFDEELVADLDLIFNEVTTSQTTAATYNEHNSSVVPVSGFWWPENEEEIKSFLKKLFRDEKKLEAQVFYSRLRSMGFQGARRSAVKHVDSWIQQKYMSALPQSTGGGRIFVLSN